MLMLFVIKKHIFETLQFYGCFTGELVKKKNAKMPYSKLNVYGIVFKELPNNLEDEIGKTPRKPALYGSAQRRELWQCRNSWFSHLILSLRNFTLPILLLPVHHLPLIPILLILLSLLHLFLALVLPAVLLLLTFPFLVPVLPALLSLLV